MSYRKGNFADFWYYNKIKIIGIVIAIFLIILGFNQCSLGEVTDLGIVHISQAEYEDGTDFLESIKKNIPLKQSEEELKLEFTPVYMPDNFKSAQELGSIEKVQVELASGESTLFILDEETLYSYENDDIFYDLSEYAKDYGINPQDCYRDHSGKVMGISVDQNSYLESVGLEHTSLYVGVRNHLESQKSEYENAFRVLEYILENR